MRSLPAVLVGIGLFLTGIALGALYHNEHVLHARELKLNARGEIGVESVELIDRGYMIRFGIALVSGSVGVGLAGAGFVLLVGRLADRRHHARDGQSTR